MFVETCPDNTGLVYKNGYPYYNGVKYRSLRELKTKSAFKLEETLINIMAQEIRKEIDNEVLNFIKDLANG